MIYENDMISGPVVEKCDLPRVASNFLEIGSVESISAS